MTPTLALRAFRRASRSAAIPGRVRAFVFDICHYYDIRPRPKEAVCHEGCSTFPKPDTQCTGTIEESLQRLAREKNGTLLDYRDRRIYWIDHRTHACRAGPRSSRHQQPLHRT